jgi:hypothetical protein
MKDAITGTQIIFVGKSEGRDKSIWELRAFGGGPK